MRIPLRPFLSFVGLLMVAAALAQSGGPVLPDPGNPHMSKDQQKQLGLQAASQVYQQMPVLPDSSPETQYIRRLGGKLVSTIPPDRTWPYEFHVVAQKEINAFALPGGQMFVNIGTIQAAANEAQLAGVMGHEMSHVYMQHSAKQQYKAEWTEGLAGLAGSILGSRGGMVGELGQMGAQYGSSLMMLKYSRTDESQADAVGAMILYKAGYNPEQLAEFFKTLEAQGGTPPQFLSDHPNPGNRLIAIQKEVASWPAQNFSSDSADFAKVRQHAMGVKSYTAQEIAAGAKSNQWAGFNRSHGAVFNPSEAINASPAGRGAQPAQGLQSSSQTAQGAQARPVNATRGNVSWSQIAPSERYVVVDLGPIHIAHPENWEVIAPKKRGDSVTIAPAAAVAGDGLGYGVVINGAAPKEQGMTIDGLTDELVRSFEAGQGGMKKIGSTRTVQVAGVTGRTVQMQSPSPIPDSRGQAQSERDQLVTVPQPDGSVVFLDVVAPVSQFEQLHPTFNKILSSVSIDTN
jgi:Zn-dependent protease with chaperone function